MIVLGSKHKFSAKERLVLKKRFSFYLIRYSNLEKTKVLNRLKTALNAQKPKLIVLNTSAKIGDEIIKFLTKLQFERSDIKIISIENFMEKYLHKCFIPKEHNDINFLENIKPLSKMSYFVKRLTDIVFASILLVLSFPIIVYSIFKIPRQSKGSAFYTQTRLGKNGKEFTCYKFRSMHKNNQSHYTQENDERVFAYGNFMRKMRIDELPQLINVLKGDMHLIGPRAEWNVLTNEYEKQIPYYQERHLISPGITGLAQVLYTYGSNTQDAHQKLMYDLYYIKHWSILLDLKIIFKTISVVLLKKGL